MFPISDSIKTGKIPFAALLLIAINLFVFVKEISIPNMDSFLIQYSLIPKEVNFMSLNSLSPFITSIFLHGGFIHILSNMWFLWIFGDSVEANLGKLKFILLFLIAGIAGNAGQFLINPGSSIPMLGASGAVSGIIGAYFVLYPRAKIKTLLLLFFFFTIVEIPALVYIFYWFILQLFSGVASLPSTFQTGGVAFWAHVMGFTAGILLAKRFRKVETPYIEGEIVE